MAPTGSPSGDLLKDLAYRFNAHVEAEDEAWLEIRDRMTRQETTLSHVSTQLTKLVDRSENAFHRYAYPLILIAATVFATMAAERVSAPAQHHSGSSTTGATP